MLLLLLIYVANCKKNNNNHIETALLYPTQTKDYIETSGK